MCDRPEPGVSRPAPLAGDIDVTEGGLDGPGGWGRGVGTGRCWPWCSTRRRRGYREVSLETGTGGFFAPAHRLYRRHGFTECGPFGDYGLDPHSTFMTLTLS